MKQMQRWEWLMGIVLILMMTLLADTGMEKILPVSGTGLATQGETLVESEKSAQHVIAIDSGHGGVDPGKVGTNGALEKDINLAIAKRVKELLEEQNILVVMVRDSDTGLYSDQDHSKKMADLNARCALINESGAEAAVSIHQNSFHDASVHGAQMFYYKNSEGGRRLAECLQKAFLDVQPDNTRSIKCNDNYYILLHVSCPMVVAECGFLSNGTEAESLSEAGYQEQVAQAIVKGVLEYLDI